MCLRASSDVFNIDIRTNIRAIERKVSNLAFQQIPWATAQAVNALGKQVIAAEQANEHKVLDRPRPFTTGALRLERATKVRGMATVVMLPATAKYLEPYEFGGKNSLNGKALLKPVGAASDLDQYGNLPRNLIRQLKGRSDIFIGPVKTKAGVINGVWQRVTDEGGFATVARGGKLVKTRRNLNIGSHLKLLVKFQDAHEVKQQLGWFDVAQRTVTRNFSKEFGRALARAMATARR